MLGQAGAGDMSACGQPVDGPCAWVGEGSLAASAAAATASATLAGLVCACGDGIGDCPQPFADTSGGGLAGGGSGGGDPCSAGEGVGDGQPIAELGCAACITSGAEVVAGRAAGCAGLVATSPAIDPQGRSGERVPIGSVTAPCVPGMAVCTAGLEGGSCHT